MHYVADLHLHSKYSRAVSQNMTLPIMSDFARKKGLDILSAPDFTHTLWFKEIQGQLQEAGEGVYKLKGAIGDRRDKGDKGDVVFLLSTEISSIYKQADKLRRIHNLVFAPSIESAEKLNKELLKRGCNLSSDGRPIIGLSSIDLLELILSIDERFLLIPAHIWTPHFGVYGSFSGFDSLSDAFGNMSKYIYGIETGLSSDPEMNWSVMELMDRSILSFSDAHSPAKMGREATVFELEKPDFENIRQAIMRSKGTTGTTGITSTTGKKARDTRGTLDTRDTSNKIVYTIEFYPEEGKYHYSGHRNCKVAFGPSEIREKGINCPVCKRRLTEGVLLRVQQLGDDKLLARAVEKKNTQNLKWYTDNLKKQPPYVKLVPLVEIIAEGLGVTQASQKVPEMYTKLIDGCGSELNILLKADLKEIENIAGDKIAKGLSKVREGDIVIDPGFDGEFGKVKIWGENEGENEDNNDTPQLSLEI
jgi:PHP family Zn ribbon phosphoesterase